MRIVIASLVIVLAFAAPVAAQVAQLKPAAKAKLDHGMRLFEEKKYEEAIKQLRKGYAISSAREFLYAMGQIERIRGNWREAKTLYQMFLSSDPSPEQASATKLQLERCDAELKKAEAPAVAMPPAAPPQVTSAPATAPALEPKFAPVQNVSPPPAENRIAPTAVETRAQPAPIGPPPWYKDALGGVLFGGGLALVGGGAAVFVVGSSAVAAGSTSLDKYVAAKGMTWAQPVGIGLMAGGGALIVGSVIRYLLLGRQTSSTQVSILPSGQGGAVVVCGSFQ